MAFQIQGANPGALLASLRTTPLDPAEQQFQQEKLQALRNENALAPLKQQEAQLDLQERQRQIEQLRQYRQIMQQYGTDPDPDKAYAAARPHLLGVLDQKQMSDFDNTFLGRRKSIAEALEKEGQADKLKRESQDDLMEGLADSAEAALRSTNPYVAMDEHLKLVEMAHPDKKDLVEKVRDQFAANPDDAMRLAEGYRTQKSRAATAKLLQDQAQTAEANQKVAQGNVQAAVQSMPDPNDPNIAQAWTDWRNGLDADTQRKIKAAYTPVEYDRVRHMAVPVDKQPEFDLNAYKAKMGLVGNSEYDQFLVQYARELGKTPKDLTPAEGLASFQKFAEFKQDPVLRANAIAMKQLTEANLRMQQGLIPSADDIQVYKKALLDHKLSPTQFNELKSRSGNMAGKVFAAAMQQDPNFSPAKAEAEFKAWEKTEADFTSGKEAGLVRSNNNAIEHLSLLEEARQALKNNDVPALARIANYFGTAVGGTAATTFDHIAARVGDEVQKAFIPGGGSAGERTAAGSGSYSSKMGDAQIASNIKADIALMDSQQRHLVDQYTRGTYGQGSQQLFTPEAQAARDRLLGRRAAAGGAALPKPTTATQPPAGKIAVISPEGTPGYIDADKWDAAQKRGFRKQ